MAAAKKPKAEKAEGEREVVQVAGRDVVITNPSKIYFPETKYTKRDLVNYFIAVADGAVRGVFNEPMALKRFVNGAARPAFFQKRAPDHRPDWMKTVTLSFRIGTHRRRNRHHRRGAARVDCESRLYRFESASDARERSRSSRRAPRRSRSAARHRGVETNRDRRGRSMREVLVDMKCTGWLKTSGSRGIHVYVRIQPKWGFFEVRRAALALSREVERRAPTIATSKWWKEERHGVFLDYNQNAKDRTVASAYSVRPTKDARVSMPLEWDALASCEPGDFTLATVPKIFKERGDAHAHIDDSPCSLEPILELSAKQERDGQGDAPWPPHFPKQPGEPRRVQPSRPTKNKKPRLPSAAKNTRSS